MKTFDTPPLLALARQRRADEIAAQELDLQRRREAEYEQREAGLLLFCRQFDLGGLLQDFEHDGIALPYIPLGPLAIVGTGEHSVTVYFRCKECGTVAYNPHINRRATIGMFHEGDGEWVFGEHEVVKILGDLDARATQIGPLCPEHRAESED